jgi:membrane protein
MATNEQIGDKGAIPPRFSAAWWKRVAKGFKLAAIDFMVDNGAHWAAAMAFYTLLSVFPLLLGIISLAGMFVDEEWATAQLASNFAHYVPEGEAAIEEIVAAALSAGGGSGVVSVVILLWSGSWVFGALTTALNMAYDVDEHYPFWKQVLLRLGLLVSVGLFMVVAVFSGPLLHLLMSSLPGEPTLIGQVVSAVVPLVLVVAAFFLVYRLVPRCKVTWPPALTGALLAATSFILSREAFVAYLAYAGREYDIIYGSLAVGVILVFWAWIVAIILLLGAEITSHLQALMVDGLTPEEVWKHHIRRSPDHMDLLGSGDGK